MSILQSIQNELNAPKSQRNNFAKFNYRSAEDILEALKPILAKHQYSVIVNDDLQLIGDRYYVKATVSLYDEKMALVVHSSAFAREELTLKGQQASQITGGTSSYARKYALNGMFLIDDNKDADSQDNTQHTQAKPVQKITDAQLKKLNTLMSLKNVDRDAMKKHYKIESFNDFPVNAIQAFIEYLEKL